MTQPKLDHGVFEADIHGQSMNFAYLKRIGHWLGPHKLLAMTSVALVIAASILAVLLPVIISRVVIDGVIMGQPDAHLPDYHWFNAFMP